MQHHWQVVNARRNAGIRTSEDPDTVWKEACSYFEWCDTHPKVIERVLTSGKEAGKQLKENRITPYSIKALCLHLGVVEEWLRDIRMAKNEDSEMYHTVSTILYLIYIQNYEMAVIGEYNAVFTAKILNIDKDDTPQRPVTISVVQGLPRLARSENEILEKLELEKRVSEK